MKALRKLSWVELKLFAREPFSLIFTLAFPIVLLIVPIGLIALPVHLAAYRERGVLRRFQASSIPAWSVIGSHLITGLTMATVGSVVLVLAAVLIYGAALPASVG